MSISERYVQNEYNKPDQYRAEEYHSDESGSPQKLSYYLNDKENTPQNKENYVPEQKAVTSFGNEREVYAFKKNDEDMAKKQEVLKQPEYNIALKDTGKNAINKIPLSESYFPNQANIPSQPMSMASGVDISQRKGDIGTPVSGLQRSSILMTGRSTPFKLHQNETTISVTNPVRRGEMLKKQTVYCIQGNDQEGTFNVVRSHADFLKIRDLLVKRWPGCYIPSVPPKRPLTKVTEEFLEGRRKEFEMFVQKMTELPHLHYSREYQVFLKSHAFDQELEPFQKIAYEEIITRYKPIFREALQLRATPEAEKKIEEFRTFLQTVHSHFKKFKKVLKKTVQTRQAYYEQLVLFHEVMSSGYEKDVLTRLENNSMDDSKRVFFNLESRELTEKVEGVKQARQTQSIEYLYAWIKAEAREIGAFMEAIEQKDLYDTKKRKALERWSSTTTSLDRTRSGKTNLAAMITGKNRDTQIHILEGKSIAQDKEAKQLQALCDVVILILAHTEIDRFKKRKSDQYYHVVNLAAQYELENLHNVMEYWGTILSSGPSRKASMNGTHES